MKTALVTGGTRGIGLAIAKKLCAAGWRVVISARHITEEAENFLSENAGDTAFFACDISIRADRERLISETIKFGKTIDLLVNNAGVAPIERRDMLELTEEAFDYVININLKGTFFLSQSAALEMQKNHNGKIINISSVSSFAVSENRAEYCIAKSGISMMTKLFASRLAEDNISVYEVMPGIIDTDMTSAVKGKYEELIAQGLTPIRRMGTAKDVADVVGALAEDRFAFSTGCSIPCDGGFHIKRL